MAEPTEPTGANASALYGFFCGLVSIPTAFIIVGVLFAVMAIVLGRLGMQRADRGEGRRGLAIAAIALGTIGILLTIVVLA
jgi:hypothetical protein